MAQNLHCIHVEEDSALPAQMTHGADRLHTTHLTLAPNDRYQSGGRFQQRLQLLQAQHTLAIHGQAFHLPAPPGEKGCSGFAGRMLHGADDQAARFEGGRAAQNGHLDGLTSPRAPHHLLRFGPEICCQIHPAALQLFRR
jgi:hypothetical protein